MFMRRANSLHMLALSTAVVASFLLVILVLHIDAAAAELLLSQLQGISDALRELERVSPSSPSFDLAVLEALEVITAHSKVRHNSRHQVIDFDLCMHEV